LTRKRVPGLSGISATPYSARTGCRLEADGPRERFLHIGTPLTDLRVGIHCDSRKACNGKVHLFLPRARHRPPDGVGDVPLLAALATASLGALRSGRHQTLPRPLWLGLFGKLPFGLGGDDFTAGPRFLGVVLPLRPIGCVFFSSNRASRKGVIFAMT
jgi:hypothetical protein